VLQWKGDGHIITLAFDIRRIERTPDSYGIVYFNGVPLNVPRDTKYSTPFSHGDQDIERVTLTDAWKVSDFLTINNRFSFLHRDVNILRNSGGTVTGTMLTGRQLREQTDHDDDFVYQFEPVWKFATGTIGHTLLTGAQFEWQQIDDNRATANLAPIANIFTPVIPETSTNGLTFLRDASHSGMIDHLQAYYYLGAYVTDQIDVTDQFKLRVSGRKDWWQEDLTPQVFVPGRIDTDTGQLFQPGVTQSRLDAPFSWSVGGLYKLLRGVAPFAGIARSYLTNFNSESTQNGVVAPESGLQHEAGIKLSTPGDTIVLTAAVFDIERTNVFNENTVTGAVTFNAQRTRGVDRRSEITPSVFPPTFITSGRRTISLSATGTGSGSEQACPTPTRPSAISPIPYGFRAPTSSALWSAISSRHGTCRLASRTSSMSPITRSPRAPAATSANHARSMPRRTGGFKRAPDPLAAYRHDVIASPI
jgi:iron complex outermembrane receptor protein